MTKFPLNIEVFSEELDQRLIDAINKGTPIKSFHMEDERIGIFKHENGSYVVIHSVDMGHTSLTGGIFPGLSDIRTYLLENSIPENSPIIRWLDNLIEEVAE